MKKLIFSVALLSAALSASAEDHPLWMRYPAISPDGTTIAFAYKGDLYSVSVNGGEARQLTTHAAFDSHPVWSPDSKKIAFQSNREGSLDIFVIDAKGGAPTRLTTNSGSETPIAFADNDHVLYSASLQPTAQSIIFGDNTFPQVYKVSTKAEDRNSSLPSPWRISASPRTATFSTTTKRDTKTLGANTRNHLSLATSG